MGEDTGRARRWESGPSESASVHTSVRERASERARESERARGAQRREREGGREKAREGGRGEDLRGDVIDVEVVPEARHYVVNRQA
eukprot:545788-Rhodomonas_salina.1